MYNWNTYADNYEKLKETERSWIGWINIVKMARLLKTSYRFNVTPIKGLMTFFPQN